MRPARQLAVRRYWGWHLVVPLVMVLATLMVRGASPAMQGLPLTRSYSLEDVGSAPRGARLDFDRFGRVAVISDGCYAVLNDTVWLNLAANDSTIRGGMLNVVQAPDGNMYYGAAGSWGMATVGKDSRIHAVPLVPSNVPTWADLASFVDLIITDKGVYFGSRNGVVYWDYSKKENLLFEIPKVSKAFRVGNRVYISAFGQPLSYLDIESGMVKTASGTELDSNAVETATMLDDSRALVSLYDGRLVVFDGYRVWPWPGMNQKKSSSRVSVLHRLVGGQIAIGVTGEGLFLFSPDGHLQLSMVTSAYSRVTALADREPGVLWVATEEGFEKVLYDSALTAFGQQLGLTLNWPIIESWNGQIFVVSGGKLSRAVAASPDTPSHFEPLSCKPAGSIWSIAAYGPHMLVGSLDEVYSFEPDGTLRAVTALRELAHLVMFDADHCYAIGRNETALLEWRNGSWTESGPRTQGISFPSVVHGVNKSAWVEMAGKVGRLWMNDGRLQLDITPNDSWSKASWINIGAVDDIVVLSGSVGERKFFDEKTGSWCEEQKLARLLERSPFWIARIQNDETGTIWAAHNNGMVRFTTKGDDYDIDVSTFDLIKDQYPVVHVLPGNDVWISAKQSLYHVERRWAPQSSRISKPLLVSIIGGRQNAELLTDQSSAVPLQLPFADNKLAFQFYSGSDVWRRAPLYEYRLADKESWTPLGGSLLSLRGLAEGRYDLQVRTRGSPESQSAAADFTFEILPPWYRTTPAYILFACLFLALSIGVIWWSSYVVRMRNRVLEGVVHERTSQLEATMAKLGEETRTAATLAERDRLANEIHDSVQQGLTGAILQLDTTLKLSAIDEGVRGRLNVVRNMVSYARQEVQHAVWDMESPLLEGTELANALRNLTSFIDSSGATIEVTVSGSPITLSRSTSHNLLRVAQEATTNAFRHANAQRIAIQLEYTAEAVLLAISDDGVGFSPEAVLRDRTGHLGLRGIQARVKKLRGELIIRSAPKQGASIRVAVPIAGHQDISSNAESTPRN